MATGVADQVGERVLVNSNEEEQKLRENGKSGMNEFITGHFGGIFAGGVFDSRGFRFRRLSHSSSIPLTARFRNS